MPEGHTLHRLARQQRRQFAGLPIEVSSPQGRFEAQLVDGRVLDGVSAHGKHLFAAFGDRIVHVHLGLYGKFTSGTELPPAPRGALRMRWTAPSGWTDLRGPTACEVLAPSEVEAVIARLGPDPLRRGADGTRAYERIRRSRAPVAGLVMDQQVLAGVGNVYRAELLFRHRLDPYLPGRELDAVIWAAMWNDLIALMRAGVRSGRIVTTHAADRARATGRVSRDDAHYVYRRHGQPCRVDGTSIRMEVLGGRKLYWCPTCQA
ncbi:MAG: Fpg/Nei family DNA glycosylase [Ilumatobacteraceae bacterium]